MDILQISSASLREIGKNLNVYLPIHQPYLTLSHTPDCLSATSQNFDTSNQFIRLVWFLE